MAIGGKEFLLDLESVPPCLRIDIHVNSPDSKIIESYKIRDVLIDTGSDLTMLPNKVINKLKLKVTGFKELENFNGEMIEVKLYSARIRIDNVVNRNIEIGGIDSECLIGMDLIKDWHILINGPYRTFEIANKSNYNLQGQNKIRK